MEFFSGFPKIKFNNTLVKNITIRLDFIKKVKSNSALFEHIQIRDGERPEDIAFLVYGDADLYWIILYINDIINPYLEWPLTDAQLTQFVSSKYGVDRLYDVHHYETTEYSDLGSGIWVDAGTPFSHPIIIYDYEASLNEAKRKIKLLKPEYINQVLSEYSKELS